ncbi:uncharacterized protein LOC134768985 [Penaeus indicus]|uniref:uncharacterized protein LOC134768985 n=1 Tax=Penaeus indicus TaxID=29960 RepID=UPI00300D472F
MCPPSAIKERPRGESGVIVNLKAYVLLHCVDYCKCLRALGKGACGSVFLVSYSGASCALKVVKASKKTAFTREVKIMRRLAGAGGAPLVLAACPEMPAFIMTYCGKVTLDKFFKQKQEFGTCIKVVRLLAKALQEVHAKGVVHCDLKSNNVLVDVDADGKPTGVHIIDFGLARRPGKSLKMRAPEG